MVTTVSMVILLSLGATAYAAFHLAHLPVAPVCPACRSVTSQPSRTTLLDRVFGALGNASARECLRCGWSGRMRWRLAPRRARHE